MKRPNVLYHHGGPVEVVGTSKMYSEIGVETPSLERLAARGVMYQKCDHAASACVSRRGLP